MSEPGQAAVAQPAVGVAENGYVEGHGEGQEDEQLPADDEVLHPSVPTHAAADLQSDASMALCVLIKVAWKPNFTIVSTIVRTS